jgi:small subunit ribosomal protein S13
MATGLTFSFRDKDLNLERELRCTLKGIYGIGWTRANWFSNRLGFGYPFSASQLNSYQIHLLSGLLNRMLRSETKIKRNVEVRIRQLQDLGNLRGRRHALFLPTRGQRSRTNAKTQKKLRYSNRANN